MHKDLVPRAFACDYRLVADLLRRVNEAFREHACLSGSGRVVSPPAAFCPWLPSATQLHVAAAASHASRADACSLCCYWTWLCIFNERVV